MSVLLAHSGLLLHEIAFDHAIIYDYESPLTITNGTGNYDIKIFDSEDLIMEEPTGSCDQNRHKVS